MNQYEPILTRNEPVWHENAWKKLLSQAISSPAELLERLELSAEKLPYHVLEHHDFMQKVPEPYLERMEKGNPYDPLLLQVLTLSEENIQHSGFSDDPLQEHENSIPGMLHKYSSRVLFMLATTCAINCRYCFRREFPYAENTPSRKDWSALFNYCQQHPEIDEVILSGGDPLAVNDGYLAKFIQQLEEQTTIKRLRIHTRLPLVIPQRVTQHLVTTLKQTPLQVVMVIHANHANELDANVSYALGLLKRAGVTLLNQSVLLKNINDNVETLADLSRRLFDCGVLPYYIHQLDPVTGIHHFEVELERGRRIMSELHHQLAGFLVPRFVQEVAGEPSKTPIDLLHKNQ